MKTILLKVVSAFAIAGQIVPASNPKKISLIELTIDESRDYLNRGKCVLPTDAELIEAGYGFAVAPLEADNGAGDTGDHGQDHGQDAQNAAQHVAGDPGAGDSAATVDAALAAAATVVSHDTPAVTVEASQAEPPKPADGSQKAAKPANKAAKPGKPE